MIGLELKILFKNSHAFITRDQSIYIDNSIINHHITNFELEAYWVIRVKSVIENERRIFCEIISHGLGKSDFDIDQLLIADELNQIETISFGKISTGILFATILKKRKIKITSHSKPSSVGVDAYEQNKEIIKPKPLKTHINQTFYYPIIKLDFKNGLVSLEQKFQEHAQKINIEIKNDEIIEEYDAIKDYFEKVLKTKKVGITVDIRIENNQVISVFAESKEIKSINKALIEEVKLNIVKASIKNKSKPKEENNLLTAEEYFDIFSDTEVDVNTLFENNEQFFENVLNVSDSKHYKHLRYLSSIHSNELMKLRFLHRPFSFVFLFEGTDQYHFIWETLNTEEATYIWHIKKDLEILMSFSIRIKEIIKMIKVYGKSLYIATSEDEFSRVFHNYDESINGFFKWKKELEEILI